MDSPEHVRLNARFTAHGEAQLKFSIAPIVIIIIALTTANVCAQSRPIPPGVRQADQVEAQTERNIPPPVGSHKSIDHKKMQRDADELAALSASIPPDMSQTAKGVLPKDVVRKLKRIEKLAKQLRNELNP